MSGEDYSSGGSGEESGHRGIAEMFVQRNVDVEGLDRGQRLRVFDLLAHEARRGLGGEWSISVACGARHDRGRLGDEQNGTVRVRSGVEGDVSNVTPHRPSESESARRTCPPRRPSRRPPTVGSWVTCTGDVAGRVAMGRVTARMRQTTMGANHMGGVAATVLP